MEVAGDGGEKPEMEKVAGDGEERDAGDGGEEGNWLIAVLSILIAVLSLDLVHKNSFNDQKFFSQILFFFFSFFFCPAVFTRRRWRRGRKLVDDSALDLDRSALSRS
ncbi:hypothetical protein CsSME_00047757 [Camellia sinensis var. sinensis]